MNKNAKTKKRSILFTLLATLAVGVGVVSSNQKPVVKTKAANTSTIVATASLMGFTGGYSDKSATIDGIGFSGNAIKTAANDFQFKASTSNVFYNTTAFPYEIKSVTIIQTGTPRAFTLKAGTSEKPSTSKGAKTLATMVWDLAGENYTYFTIDKGSNAGYVSSITIEYQSSPTQEFGTLTSISLNHADVLKNYYVGEAFSSTGLIVTALDEKTPATEKIVDTWTTDYDDHTFISSDIGEKQVTVSYSENDILKTASYAINVMAAPLINTSMANFSWVGLTSGSVYKNQLLTENSRSWRLSSTEYWSGNTMLGDYGGSANGAWATFSSTSHFTNIASQLTTSTYGFAMYTQSFAIQNLNRIEFTWSVTSGLGATNNVYVLGSTNGGFTWDVLKQQNLNASVLSIDWSDADKYDESDDVIVALAFTTTVNNSQLRNITMKLDGDELVTPEWSVHGVTVTGAVNLIGIGDTTQYSTTIQQAELPANTDIIWSSSDESVAIVSSTGLITGIGVGTATITATAADGYGATNSKTVEVITEVPVLSNITAVLKTPSKVYTEVDVLTISEFVVTANYTAGKASAVVSNATITSGATLSVGLNTVNLSYTENGITKTTQIEITAIAVIQFNMITSNSQLHLNATYVIGAKASNMVMSIATDQANYRQNVASTITSNRVLDSSATQKLELVNGYQTGTYAFRLINGDNSGKYLSLASNANNLQVSDSIAIESSWTITVETDGTTTITSSNQTTRFISYNSSSPRFASYTSTQTAIQLYVDETTIVTQEQKDLASANAFKSFVMHADRDSEACEDKFAEAFFMWDEMTSGAQNLVKTHEDFTETFARYANWAIANGSTIDGENISARSTYENTTSNSIGSALIIGLIGLTSLAGYYFITKRKELV